MASISETKPCRANLRPILTPFTKPHTHHSQHYWLTLSSLHSLWGYLKSRCHIVASNDQCQQLYGNWLAMIHPHCQIVASNDQFGNFVATDIAFGNVKQLLPKCCHAIVGKYIASNDKLCGNVESDIAGDFVATPSPLGCVQHFYCRIIQMF